MTEPVVPTRAWYLRPSARYAAGLVITLTLLAYVGNWWLTMSPWPRASWQLACERCDQLEFSPDGRVLVATHNRGLTLFDVATGQVRGNVPLDNPFTNCAYPLWFSPDSKILVFIPPVDHALKIWHWDAGQEPLTLTLWDLGRSFIGPEDVVGFTPDSSYLVTKYPSRLWDVATRQARFKEPTFSSAVAILPDGRVLSVDPDGGHPRNYLSFVWDLATGRWLHELPDVRSRDREAALFSQDGRLLAVCCGPDGHRTTDTPEGLKLFDMSDGRLLCFLQENGQRILPLLFSPDSRRLLSAPNRWSPQAVWDVTQMPPHKLGTVPPGDPQFSADSRRLLIWEHTVKVYDMTTLQPEPLPELIPSHWPSRPKLSPDSRTVASHTTYRMTPSFWPWSKWGDQVLVWNLDARKQVAAIPDCQTFAYSPDSQMLATFHDDKRIQLWDLPARHPALLLYGLPVVFGVVLIFGYWNLKRIRRTWRQGTVV